MDTDMSTQQQRRSSDDAYAASYFDPDENISSADDETREIEIRATTSDRLHRSSSPNCLKRQKLDKLSIIYCVDYKTSTQHHFYISPNQTLANLRKSICKERKRSPDETALWYRHENQWKRFYEEQMSNTLDELDICNEALLSITRHATNNTCIEQIPVPTNSVCTSPTTEKSVYHRILITQSTDKQTQELEYNLNYSLNEFKEIIKEKFDIKDQIDDLHLYSENIEIDTDAVLKNITKAIVVVQKQPRSTSPQNRNRRVGLLNVGNTCFMNSVLQCLMHIPTLTNYFRYNSVEGSVASAYQKLIQHVWNRHEEVVDPREIKQTVSRYASRFSDFNQQDAREFLSILLNRLDEDLKSKQQHTIITELFHCRIDTVFSCSNCDKILRTPNGIHFIPLPLRPKERIFTILFVPLDRYHIQESIYISVIKNGSIGHVVRNFVEKYSDVSFRQLKVRSSQTHEEILYETALRDVSDQQLTIIEEDGEVFSQRNISKKQPRTLTDCLRDYFASELLDDPWYCNGKCQRETNAEKRLQLIVVPPVLVFQLERFTNVNGVRRKLEIFVDYPIDDFNLNELLKNGNGKAIYDLVAVVNHSGSIGGGHYVACAREVGMNNWYRFSDSLVDLAQPNDLVSSDAYLLFYMQKIRTETAC